MNKDEMTLNDFQSLSRRTMPADFDDMAKANYALGATGEAGEVADIVKKEVFHGHPADVEAVKKEIGDTLHYLAGLATIYGLTLEEVALANIEKLKRRYPDGFSVSDSIARVDVNVEISKEREQFRAHFNSVSESIEQGKERIKRKRERFEREIGTNRNGN